MNQQMFSYKNSRSLTLYFVTIVTLALSIFVVYMIFNDLDAFFEEYSSRVSGIFWFTFMLVAGNIMFACMLWLSGRYILKIELADENHILITTWSMLGFHKTEKHPAEILKTETFCKGVSNHFNAPVVVAPYSILKTTTGKKLILDEQGFFELKTRLSKTK